MEMKRNYLRMLEEGFAEFFGDEPISRLEYLSNHIFDFTTYDDEIAELFARKALEVCSTINSRTTFEYIEDAEQYRWYLIMVNMPFFVGKLEWGTSIRGAWWAEYSPNKKIEFSSCGLFLDGEQLHETMQFTREEWHDFICAVLEFASKGT